MTIRHVVSVSGGKDSCIRAKTIRSNAMCVVTVRYADGSIVTWKFERKTRLVDAMQMMRKRGPVQKVVL